MKNIYFLFSVVILFFLSESCFAATTTVCNPAHGGNTTGMNYDCTDSSKPYCSLTSFNGVTPVYTCVQCVSGCDCSRNDFCSQAPGNVGTCQKFKKYGNGCRALSSQQIMNSTFPDKWKCAATFTVNGTIFIDQAGVCNAGTCRYCVPYSFNGICRLDTGKAEERYCVYPGYFVAGHSYFWQDANYYTNPKLVWLAIFFCFFIISGGVQFATAIISYRKGGIGRSKPNETKHDSVKKTSQHSTISPPQQNSGGADRSSDRVQSAQAPSQESQPPPYSPMDVADAPQEFKD